MEKWDLTDNRKSNLFAIFSPAHCRMEKREGGAIVEVYIILFLCQWWKCSDELGEILPFSGHNWCCLSCSMSWNNKDSLSRGKTKRWGKEF